MADPKQNENQDKTFTQEELNAILGDRVKREKEKYADYEDLKSKAQKYDEAQAKNKSELEKANEKAAELQAKIDAMEKANTIRGIRDKVSSEMGVPSSLLNAETEEECKTQAQAILDFTKKDGIKKKYPDVKDKGEGNPPTLTKEEILKIKDEKKRLKAIQENIDLF